MSEAKLMITGALGNKTVAIITLFADESWEVVLQGPEESGMSVKLVMTEDMVAELQGLLRRAGVGRKKKGKADV